MIHQGQGRPNPFFKASLHKSSSSCVKAQSGSYYRASSVSFNDSEGFTLVEILIAMVLIAIGFLGMLSMQSFSLQQSHDTHFSNKANYLIRDITDRMRLNSTQVDAYVFTTDDSLSAQNCTSNSCTPSQIAQSDKVQWANEVKGLPGGKGQISQPVNAAPNMVDILVSWQEKDSKLTSTLSTAELCSPDEGETSLRRCIKLRVHI